MRSRVAPLPAVDLPGDQNSYCKKFTAPLERPSETDQAVLASGGASHFLWRKCHVTEKALLASSLLAGLYSTQVSAVEFKVDEDVGCYAGTVHLIQHADGYLSGSFDLVNMRMVKYSGNSPVNMPTLLSAHCAGTFAVVNGEPESNGSCEVTDGSSDRYFGLFHRKGDPKKVEGELHVIHGTGKFAGMTLDLKYKEIGEIPPPGMTNTIGGCDRAVGAGNAPGIK